MSSKKIPFRGFSSSNRWNMSYKVRLIGFKCWWARSRPTLTDTNMRIFFLVCCTLIVISTNRSFIETMYYVICLCTTWENNYNLYLKLKNKHSYVITIVILLCKMMIGELTLVFSRYLNCYHEIKEKNYSIYWHYATILMC